MTFPAGHAPTRPAPTPPVCGRRAGGSPPPPLPPAAPGAAPARAPRRPPTSARRRAADAQAALPDAERGRPGSYVTTARAGAAVPLGRLRTRARDFDPAVRDRLIAGAMIPAPLVAKAQKFRRWYRARVLELFARVDVVLAPVTPCTAPRIGQKTFRFDGVEIPLRANIGVYTQPISFIGLPVVVVPVPLEPLPIGVQIIAAPWREDIALRVARTLEIKGAVAAPRPPM